MMLQQVVTHRIRTNHRLYDTRETYSQESLDKLRLVVSQDNAVRIINEYLHQAEALSSGILNAMAAAQTFAQNAKVGYRNMWSDRDKYLNLRILSYHPGPEKKASGDTIMTTAKHTDATWLTLLWNDDIKGLHIQPGNQDIVASSPTQGALLVNTGNVMSEHSGNFYRAVCHWVLRNKETEVKTRVSMPFFFDRNGGKTGGC